MDGTETYIKMCDCEEIQTLKKHQPVTHYKLKNGLIIDVEGNYIVWLPKPIPDYQRDYPIWLPRQDDLQEMVDFEAFWMEEPHKEYSLATFLYFARSVSDFLPSMEQLWLAFVMKEKYNKIWDGDKWMNT